MLKVISDEKRSIAWQEVSEIRYPTYTGNGSGCMGCILIPGFNIGFIIWAYQRWEPRLIRMADWKLIDAKTVNNHLDSLIISAPANKKQPSP